MQGSYSTTGIKRITANMKPADESSVRVLHIANHGSSTNGRMTGVSVSDTSRYHQTTTENRPNVGACSVTETMFSAPVSLIKASAWRRIRSRLRSPPVRGNSNTQKGDLNLSDSGSAKTVCSIRFTVVWSVWDTITAAGSCDLCATAGIAAMRGEIARSAAAATCEEKNRVARR